MIKTEEEKFDRVCNAVFEYLELQGELFVEVDIVDEDTIQQVNADMRGVDKPTDVLSFGIVDCTIDTKVFDKKTYPFEFSQPHNAVLLGSILICQSIAEEQAIEYGQSTETEIEYLFMHGLLHLLGYDHIQDSDKIIMRQVENDIVQILAKK